MSETLNGQAVDGSFIRNRAPIDPLNPNQVKTALQLEYAKKGLDPARINDAYVSHKIAQYKASLPGKPRWGSAWFNAFYDRLAAMRPVTRNLGAIVILTGISTLMWSATRPDLSGKNTIDTRENADWLRAEAEFKERHNINPLARGKY